MKYKTIHPYYKNNNSNTKSSLVSFYKFWTEVNDGVGWRVDIFHSVTIISGTTDQDNVCLNPERVFSLPNT